MPSNLVLYVAKEASFGSPLFTMLINNPLLVFKELAILNKCLVNVSLLSCVSSSNKSCVDPSMDLLIGVYICMASCVPSRMDSMMVGSISSM